MTDEQQAALVLASQAAREQLMLILVVNGQRAIRKGEIEHSKTLRELQAALAPFENESVVQDSVADEVAEPQVFGSVHMLYGAKEKKTAHRVGDMVQCANCLDWLETYEPQRILENGKITHFACPSERAHST